MSWKIFCGENRKFDEFAELVRSQGQDIEHSGFVFVLATDGGRVMLVEGLAWPTSQPAVVEGFTPFTGCCVLVELDNPDNQFAWGLRETVSREPDVEFEVELDELAGIIRYTSEVTKVKPEDTGYGYALKQIAKIAQPQADLMGLPKFLPGRKKARRVDLLVEMALTVFTSAEFASFRTPGSEFVCFSGKDGGKQAYVVGVFLPASADDTKREQIQLTASTRQDKVLGLITNHDQEPMFCVHLRPAEALKLLDHHLALILKSRWKEEQIAPYRQARQFFLELEALSSGGGKT